jgi:BMFP domain-containing protein YqiC
MEEKIVNDKNVKHSAILSSKNLSRFNQIKNSFFFSIRKSVEEAGRSVEKTHRRLTTHLNKTDTVREEEENGSDSYEIDKREQNSLPPRRFHRQSEYDFIF